MADSRSANRIKGKWSAGEAAIMAWLQIPSAHHSELLATLGFDGLVVDLQHSMIGFDTAVEMFSAIELRGCEPFVRTGRNNAADIGKLLDGGASGVIAPLIDTAQEAEALIRAIHYPPTGCRSLGPRRPLLRWGPDYRIHTLELIVSLAMIETRSGLDEVQGILSVPHLDGLFVGPSDLALALGRDPAADPTDQLVLDAIRHVRECAHAAGKRVGIFCGSRQAARERLAEGFDLVSIGTDLQMLAGAAGAGLELVRS